MQLLPILCVVFGVLIIIVRAPMIFAPGATLAFARRLVATETGVRVLGVATAPLAAALIESANEGGVAADTLHVFGWLSAAASLWLIFVPRSYQKVALGVLGFLESSVDMAILRIVGVFAVAIGGTLIYVGLYIL